MKNYTPRPNRFNYALLFDSAPGAEVEVRHDNSASVTKFHANQPAAKRQDSMQPTSHESWREAA